MKTGIEDAVVENNGPLVVGDNKWLTIAAHDEVLNDSFMTGDPEVMALMLCI